METRPHEHTQMADAKAAAACRADAASQHMQGVRKEVPGHRVAGVSRGDLDPNWCHLRSPRMWLRGTDEKFESLMGVWRLWVIVVFRNGAG